MPAQLHKNPATLPSRNNAGAAARRGSAGSTCRLALRLGRRLRGHRRRRARGRLARQFSQKFGGSAVVVPAVLILGALRSRRRGGGDGFLGRGLTLGRCRSRAGRSRLARPNGDSWGGGRGRWRGRRMGRRRSCRGVRSGPWRGGRRIGGRQGRREERQIAFQRGRFPRHLLA